MPIIVQCAHDGDLDPAEAQRILERVALLDAEQREAFPAIVARQVAEKVIASAILLGLVYPSDPVVRN